MANTNVNTCAKIDRLTDMLRMATAEQLERALATTKQKFTDTELLCLRTAHSAIHGEEDVINTWMEGNAPALLDALPTMSRRESELFNLADAAVESLIRCH